MNSLSVIIIIKFNNQARGISNVVSRPFQRTFGFQKLNQFTFDTSNSGTLKTNPLQRMTSNRLRTVTAITVFIFVFTFSFTIYLRMYGSTLSEDTAASYAILDLLALVIFIVFLVIDIALVISFLLSRRKSN